MSQAYVQRDYEQRKEEWHAEWRRRADRYLRHVGQQHEDAEEKARRLSALAMKAASSPDNSPAAQRRAQLARRRADEAWAQVRLLDVPRDPLGEPVDPRPAGRLKFERAWTVRTGMPLLHPDDDKDTTEEHPGGVHRAGLHPDPGPRGYFGNLPACDGCMLDEDWVMQWACHLAVRARAGRPMSAAQKAWLASDPLTPEMKASLDARRNKYTR